MNNFLNNFHKYDFPKLGFIRIPKIIPNKSETERFNLNDKSISKDLLIGLGEEGFKNWIKQGKISNGKEKIYLDRLHYELKEIINLHFTDYILMVYRIVEFCKNNRILMSPARGSCGGSLLLALIGCTTKLDPISMDLLFERFISSARTEIKEFDGEMFMSSDALPDIDLDINQQFKSEVYHFLESLFPNRVAHIANISTFQSKVLLKEVLKVYKNFSEDDTKVVSGLIQTKFGKVEEIDDALKDNKEFIKWSKDFPDVIEISKKLNFLIKNKSVHAAGIILCNEEITNSIPLELSSDKRIVTGYNMESAQKFGIKVDILSLKNLDSIQHTLDLVGKKMEDIDINDPSIYEFINTSDQFYGIFQAEENLGKTVLKNIKPQNINDIGASIALGRPGCMSLIDDYLNFDSKSLEDVDIRVRPILAKNKNCIIFQETIMELAKVMANFSPKDADGLRKGIGKKLMDKVLQYKDQFINGALKNKYKKEFVEWCWNIFEASGNYNFNRSHAMGYGALTSICCYLKKNHPLEYFVSLLNAAKNEQDPRSEISQIAAELQSFNIKLLPPCILRSTSEFKIEDKQIRFSLNGIKGINNKGIDRLKQLTNEYSNRFQIYSSFKQAKIPINILVASTLVGAFDDIVRPFTRSRIALEAQIWGELTDNERIWCFKLAEEYNYDLIEIIKALNEKIRNEKGKSIIRDSRRLTIRKGIEKFLEMYNFNCKHEDLAKYCMEKFYIGFSYSTNLYNIYSPKVENLMTISEINGGLENSKVKFVAEVIESKLSTSKNGNPYLKLMVKDHTGELKTMIFGGKSNKLDQCKEMNNGRFPKDGSIVIVEGIKKDGNCIFADKITEQVTDIFLKISQLPKNKENE